MELTAGAPRFAPGTHKQASGQGSALAVGMRSSSYGGKEKKGKKQGLGMLMPSTYLVKSSSPIMCRGMGEYRDGVTCGGMG